MLTWRSVLTASFVCVSPPALAEVWDSLGAPRLSVLPGLGDGSGRDGLLSNAGHQPLWTECVHTEMGSPILLTPNPVTPCPVAHSQPQRRGQRQLLWQGEDACTWKGSDASSLFIMGRNQVWIETFLKKEALVKCVFSEAVESNQVHLKTLNCQRFVSDRKLCSRSKYQRICLVIFCNESFSRMFNDLGIKTKHNSSF